MLHDAMNGKIRPDTILVEATSGNTGIGRPWSPPPTILVLIMPDTMSVERRSSQGPGAWLLTPALRACRGQPGPGVAGRR